MPRIQPISPASASPEQQQIFTTVKHALGVVPNLVATLAQSPAAANAYLAFNQALSKGALSPQLREQISLAVGEANSCDYCVAAHSLLGEKAGLAREEVRRARQATSSDPRSAAAVAFAQKIVSDRGIVEDADLATLRGHGFTEGEIAEIIANTALNIFTNYFNHIAGTTVDFPVAPKLETCGCGH